MEATAVDLADISDPAHLLECSQGCWSERKLRLALCGFCRRVWYMVRDRDSRRAVEVAERYADGEASAPELAAAFQRAWDTWSHWPRIDALGFRAVSAATWVARPGVAVTEAFRVLELTLAAEARLDPEDARRDRCDLLRCLLGNPSQPANLDPACRSWEGGKLRDLARAVYEERAFERMPVLGDALEEAGCTCTAVLEHCRQSVEHERGCWVLDLLLEKS